MSTKTARPRRAYSKPFLITLNTDAPRIVVSHQSNEQNGAGPQSVTPENRHDRGKTRRTAHAPNARPFESSRGGHRPVRRPPRR